MQQFTIHVVKNNLIILSFFHVGLPIGNQFQTMSVGLDGHESGTKLNSLWHGWNLGNIDNHENICHLIIIIVAVAIILQMYKWVRPTMSESMYNTLRPAHNIFNTRDGCFDIMAMYWGSVKDKVAPPRCYQGCDDPNQTS
jgi:hypothetical protein